MKENIVTRFAPSPTGYLHLGGARTAIFNWLYARHTNGEFILRIEDTDVQRSTKESVDAIFDALEWLGIDWDRGPFYQSQRYDIYQAYIQKLIDSGNAYYCSCSSERLEEIRKKAMESGGKPKYDGACREKGLTKSDDTVVRFKAPIAGTTVLEDAIKGNIVFQNHELDDFIIQRSDGNPIYNFVVVIDDIEMGVNTVIRGDDHVNNTPKQMLLYKALGVDLPVFGHVPMVLGSDKTRLSKRHGAMSITAYRDMGYLPDAMINYLVRLGWSYGDQEFFEREDLIEKFSLNHVGKSAGVFNPEKLLALNADHIKAASPRQLSGHLTPFLKEKGLTAEAGDYLEAAIGTLQSRSKTLVEMADGAAFYFQDELEYDEAAVKKFLIPDVADLFRNIIDEFRHIDDFTEKHLEEAFKRVIDKTGLKFGKIAQPLRVALTGKTVSPGIFEIIEVLGKDKVIERMEKATTLIPT